ncbi:MAG: MarR family transcriptional regulator, partial [Armatimonadetes bacterium]|nr:MarR family transcriptional regulator [Armatimonadota bacterium]
AEAFPIDRLHQALDGFAALYCPVASQFGTTYHWSLMQAEYATDIVFHRQADRRPLYEVLVRTAIHAVKPDHIATFLGRKLTGNYADELGNDFHTRIEGTRLKHHMGPVSIKLYDKQGLVLRIETTVNDVSFFRHHRTVEHRDHTTETKLAPMQKTIYSLAPLRDLVLAANRRYLAFLSDLTDPSAGVRQVERLAQPVRQEDRSYRGFNLFNSDDLALFLALVRGEWQISGLRNASLRRVLSDRSGPQVSRLLKRLHLHGLIKKIGHTYKYYLSETGRRVALTALKLRHLVVIPSLAEPLTA